MIFDPTRTVAAIREELAGQGARQMFGDGAGDIEDLSDAHGCLSVLSFVGTGVPLKDAMDLVGKVGVMLASGRMSLKNARDWMGKLRDIAAEVTEAQISAELNRQMAAEGDADASARYQTAWVWLWTLDLVGRGIPRGHSRACSSGSS